MGPSQAKGVVIGEKRPREGPSSSPNKKGKIANSPKGNETASAPEPMKKAIKGGDMAYSKATPSSKPGKGSSPNLGTVLGPGASTTGSDSPHGQGKGREADLGSDSH